MTPADLRQIARELDAQGKALLDAGRPKDAVPCFLKAEYYEAAAEEMERLRKERALPFAKRSVSLKGMTPGQIERRARAIAGAAANKSKDRFLQAIKGSQWRSMNKYARERLGISPGMLTFYRQGRYQVPAAIAKQVHQDLGLAPDKRTWPGGIAT